MRRKSYSYTEMAGLDKSVRWYLIANRTEARFYKDVPGTHFTLMEKLLNAEGDLKNRELETDRPGRGYSSANTTERHAYESHSNHHEEVLKKFVHEVADKLSSIVDSDHSAEFVFAVDPTFLGYLRKALSSEVSSRVKHEIKHEYKDYSNQDQKLYEQIQSALKKA
ncbi:MAG: host attachment protein [Bacteriovoracia bacterium]